MTYFHGSDTPHKIGSILVARKRTISEFIGGRAYDVCGLRGKNIEHFFERLRPARSHGRLQGIFMVRELSLLNLAGGSDRYVYEVVPYKPQKHHWGWFSHVLGLRGKNCLKIAEWCAKNYWSGAAPPAKRITDNALIMWRPNPKGERSFFGTWEWLSPRVRIVARWRYDRRTDSWYRSPKKRAAPKQRAALSRKR